MKTELKKFKNNAKLRLSLLRIWFMKNIVVIIQVVTITCILFMLTGVINSNTPILGATIYKIFSPLLDEINKIIAEKEIDGLMSFFSVFSSIMMSVGMFTMKCRSIAYEDIKDDNLKLALVQARLYFNEDGKLTKKLEKVTGTDLDGDGMVDGVEEAVSKKRRKRGIISNIKNAAEELVIITSVKLDGETEEENEAKVEQALEEANLDEAAETLEEIDNDIKETIEEVIPEKIAEKVAEEMVERIDEEELPEGYEVPTLFSKIKEKILRLFKKKDKETTVYEDDSQLEVIENSIVDDSVIKQDTKQNNKSVEVKNNNSEDKVVKKQTSTNQTTQEKTINDFLKNLKK